MENIKEMQYSLLDDLIKKVLIACKYDISHYKIVGDIGKLIISLDFTHSIYHDIDVVDIREADAILEKFLQTISPDLLDTYLNVKSQGVIHYVSYQDSLERKEFLENNYDQLSEEQRKQYKIDSKKNKSYIDEHGNLTIVLRGCLDDVFKIAHEYLHKIFYQKLGNDDTYDNINFLVEIASTTIEVMLADYLVENNLYTSSALKCKYNTIKLLEPFIYRYLMEMALIQIYENEGRVTPESLEKYIMELEEPYRTKFYNDMDGCIAEIISEGFIFWYYNRYIVAVFVSYYLKDIFKSDINSMFRLGTNIYGNNLGEALSSSGIDFMHLTNIILRLLGRDKYKKNEGKIAEIFEAMKRDYQECVMTLQDMEVKR